MASAILSAFPRPPTHIPTSPLPQTPGSSSRPTTPSGRRTPGAPSAHETPFASTPILPSDADAAGSSASTTAALKERRRSRGASAAPGAYRGVFVGEEAMMPRMSVESTMAFANVDGASSPTESSFSHTTFATATTSANNRERVGHYENLRRTLLNSPNGTMNGERTSQYSQGTADGSSGSSAHGHLALQTPSALSSRPNSFIGPGTPPLNVPLSASARLAALRAKRTGLNALNITSPPPGGHIPLGDGQKTPGSGSYAYRRQSWGSVSAAGPPPTTPLPPIPTTPMGRKENRKSINLASPTQASFPFPKSLGPGTSTAATTPTTATFPYSAPSVATFGHGIGGAASVRDGEHSRASSFGSTGDMHRGGVYTSTMPLKLGLGNGSVATFGGGGSPSEFGGEDSNPSMSGTPPRQNRPGHMPNFSTSTTTSNGTAYAAIGRRVTRLSTESFNGGLAAIAALSRVDSGTGSQSSNSPNGPINNTMPAPQILGVDMDDEPLDVQKELELLRREKAERRVSSASMLSNFSTRSNNTFRGAASKVMDVSPEEVQDDEGAELAGERLLGSVGAGLEGLASTWGPGKRTQSARSLASAKLGIGTPPTSRPGSSRGDRSRPTSFISSVRKGSLLAEGEDVNSRTQSPSAASLVAPSLTQSISRGHSPAYQSSAATTPFNTLPRSQLHQSYEEDDADETITLNRAPSLSSNGHRATARESLFSLYARRESDDSIQTFEPGVVGSGSTFASRISEEIENRNSVASSNSAHLMIKPKGTSSKRTVPDVTLEDASDPSGKTPMAFPNKPLSDDHRSTSNIHTSVSVESHESQDRLVNISVWDDAAPVTPNSASSHATASPNGWLGQLPKGPASNNVESAMDESLPRTSISSSHSDKSRLAPSTSSSSASALTITPGTAFAPSGVSSSKPSLELERPSSAMSSGLQTPFPAPPALNVHQATPLSSETSLAMYQYEDQDEEDDVLASPSAGRDRGKQQPAARTSRKARASEDFAVKLEREMAQDGMQGEFALLQEVAVREKRMKLALFGRGGPTLSRPKDRRPQSMAAIEKKLPDSPDREDSRADGASSPEIEEMIRRGRKSLSSAQKKAMRRRRSTGAIRPYPSGEWRRSEVDRALGFIKPGESTRKAMDIDRDRVMVRDSVVLELPPEEKYREPELEVDEGAETDSSIDLHTPLPRLMLKDGLLSPHSKILRPPTPEEEVQGSRMSIRSTLKVPKPNDKRKRRHRDGKLLREGVGLTTGLGWSDSEDEDAPSPLTRRLSTMTLNSTISRKGSMASSINSYGGSSFHLSRSPSMPSIPSGATISSASLASKHSSTSSGSDATSRNEVPRTRAVVFVERSPYGQPPVTPKPALKPSATMSIIEHAQMLPTASLFKSRNHPLASSSRHPTFNFSMGDRRSSSPAGNSSQSSSGGVIPPVTPEADRMPSLGHDAMLKDMSTPEDLQGASGASSIGFGSASISGAGAGLAAMGRGRSWTSPPSPSPVNAMLPGDDEITKPTPRPAEVRYSGGNFSYPTAMRQVPGAPPATPGSETKKPDGLKKPAPRGLQMLTLPTVVAAGGRLSPRAGTFALPSSPSLQNGATTPKKSGLPLPGGSLSKSSGNIAAAASAASSAVRARSGSTGSTNGNPAMPPLSSTPMRTSSRMPQSTIPRNRTLSGGVSAMMVAPAEPVTPPLPPAPATGSIGKKGLGSLRSIVSSRSTSETAGSIPRMLGVARATSAPGSPPTRIAPPSVTGKTGAGMTYRKSAGSATEAAGFTPMKSKIATPPSSTSRLAAPSSYTLTRTPSTASLTPSVVGVAL